MGRARPEEHATPRVNGPEVAQLSKRPIHMPPEKPLQRTWQHCAGITRVRIDESQASSAAVQSKMGRGG